MGCVVLCSPLHFNVVHYVLNYVLNYVLHSLHVDNSPEIEQYKAISGEALKNGGIFHACNLDSALLI